jgi:tape measure domain-containing protein
MKLFELEATIGLDDSAYRQSIQNVQSETKKTVSTLSSEYSKAAKAVVELTKRYNESVGKTGKASSETKNLKTMLAQAEAQLKSTTTALKSANNGMEGFASSTEKASGSSLSGAITQGTIMAGVFQKLASVALNAAKSFISAGLDYNAQIETYTTGLTNMLGSAEAAQQVMENIQADAARTPFDVESLTKANQYLISAGENASYARKTINALGDAVAATGGGSDELNRMAQNLQQIANTGKATAVDIKQFAYAGINVYGILADYTGKSTAEVQKMTISYDLLTEALQAASEEGGRYYNAMDDLSQTQNGRTNTLKDNVKQLAGLMTSDLADGIGMVTSNLNTMTVAAIEAYKTDGWKGLGDAILELDNPINAVIKKFGELGSAAVSALDKASYYLNKALGKNAYADYDTYEDYANDQLGQKNRDRLRQNALNGISVSNKSWSERQAEIAAANGNGTDSSITTSPTGTSSTKKTKSKTEKVIESISHTATTTSQNALGTVTTSIQTLNEKVEDSTGKIKDRVTTTTTETGKEMVNGVETTYKKVETRVNGTVTKVTKTYDDMSKTLLGTLTSISETTFNGITTKIQEATEKYADGSEHVKRTETETGEHIVDGVAQTYTKVITYIDGVQDKVTETETAIDKSVKATQTRIDQYLSGASSESNKGIFGILRSFISDAKNGDAAAIGLDFVNLLWGEVTQDQREAISKWAKNALEVINEAYSGGGLKNAFTVFEKIFTGGGVEAGVDGVTTKVIGLTEALQKLGATGGAGGVLANVGTGLASFGSKIMGVLGNVVAFVAENPIALAIAAVVAGAVGLGIALWKKYKSDSSSSSSSSSKLGYKDLQDAYWYGNERAFAGYDYRSDPYMFNPNNSTMLSYQTKMQDQLARLTEVVQQYLPDVANQQIVLDDGTLVGKMAPGMDAQLGQLSVLAERGN